MAVPACRRDLLVTEGDVRRIAIFDLPVAAALPSCPETGSYAHSKNCTNYTQMWLSQQYGTLPKTGKKGYLRLSLPKGTLDAAAEPLEFDAIGAIPAAGMRVCRL